MKEDLHAYRKLITFLMSMVMVQSSLTTSLEFTMHLATQKSNLDSKPKETSSWSSCLSGTPKKKMVSLPLKNSANTTVILAQVVKLTKNLRP